jgi:hypothetical protein
MNTSQLINAYYLAYEKGLVSSVCLNGYKSSSITRESLLQICKNFPQDLLEGAKTISRADAFTRYESARLKTVN